MRSCCLPSDEEIAPYVAALESLEAEYYSQACAQAAQINSLESSVDRLYVLLKPLLAQGSRTKQPYAPFFYHNEVYLKSRQSS